MNHPFIFGFPTGLNWSKSELLSNNYTYINILTSYPGLVTVEGLSTIFLHGCEIKSGHGRSEEGGLGMKLLTGLSLHYSRYCPTLLCVEKLGQTVVNILVISHWYHGNCIQISIPRPPLRGKAWV